MRHSKRVGKNTLSAHSAFTKQAERQMTLAEKSLERYIAQAKGKYKRNLNTSPESREKYQKRFQTQQGKFLAHLIKGRKGHNPRFPDLHSENGQLTTALSRKGLFQLIEAETLTRPKEVLTANKIQGIAKELAEKNPLLGRAKLLTQNKSGKDVDLTTARISRETATQIVKLVRHHHSLPKVGPANNHALPQNFLTAAKKYLKGKRKIKLKDFLDYVARQNNGLRPSETWAYYIIKKLNSKKLKTSKNKKK